MALPTRQQRQPVQQELQQRPRRPVLVVQQQSLPAQLTWQQQLPGSLRSSALLSWRPVTAQQSLPGLAATQDRLTATQDRLAAAEAELALVRQVAEVQELALCALASGLWELRPWEQPVELAQRECKVRTGSV